MRKCYECKNSRQIFTKGKLLSNDFSTSDFFSINFRISRLQVLRHRSLVCLHAQDLFQPWALERELTNALKTKKENFESEIPESYWKLRKKKIERAKILSSKCAMSFMQNLKAKHFLKQLIILCGFVWKIDWSGLRSTYLEGWLLILKFRVLDSKKSKSNPQYINITINFQNTDHLKIFI